MKYPNLHDTLPKRIALIAVLFAVNSLAFMYLNENPFREPSFLPLIFIDEAIPFLPWTVWPYVLMLTSNVILPFLLRRDLLFRAVLIAYFAAMSLNLMIWAGFPTAFPRPDLPLGDSMSESFYRWMVSFDSGTNCFPSGHVTIPTVLIWGLTVQWKKYRWWLWGALGVSAMTILTTKQHYFWDLLGGLATAGVGIAIALMWLKKQDRL
jgi:hypothetical protein